MSDTFDLMIPDANALPAYIIDKNAREANDDALAGISTGVPPRIKLVGKQFALVDGNGEERAFPPSKLVTGPDENVYLPVIVLRAKKQLQKMWYAQAYNKDAEGQMPDCWSNDGERPDSSVANPQNETCVGCPLNAFNSGTDQSGNPTKGKACADTKTVAIYVPGFGVHALKIPPASLKNWGLFLKTLTAHNIIVTRIKTLIGFDLTTSFPKLVFRYGGPVPQASLPKLEEMQGSMEVDEIITGIISAPASSAQLPAPEPKPEPKPKPQPKPKPELPQQATPQDDLGLGLEPVQQVAANTTTASATTISDDELARDLGL